MGETKPTKSLGNHLVLATVCICSLFQACVAGADPSTHGFCLIYTAIFVGVFKYWND